MRGISGLASLIREYVEDRNGRIGWWYSLDLWVDSAGKRKRLMRRGPNGPILFDEMDQSGRKFALYKGRAAKCKNVAKWDGAFPILGQDSPRPFVTVPQNDCRACEFHEAKVPYSKRRKYAACKWFRENSGMKSPLELYAGAVNKAEEFLR